MFRKESIRILLNDKRNFVWLKRQMTNELIALGSIKKWKNFIDTVEEPKRIYPEKDIASQFNWFCWC